MHIDHDGMVLETEADVEQKIILPLLTGAAYLDIPGSKVKSKQYLAPTPLNKKAGRTSGSYPDFSVWFRSFPCLIVEAKSPEVPAETGYLEAQLYAQFLNQYYPTGINPACLILATNGIRILCGYWDALDNQLAAFQLTLWFMHMTKAFVILQMRDETYERFKNKPPLDTYSTGVIFHISPPRFVDVVKRRLELSIEFLGSGPQDDRSYEIETGLRIRYTQRELVDFLTRLYDALFDRRRNVSRVLESLAGKDVRRALAMFVSIITSGHLSETVIASNTLGGAMQLKEYTILKILMRTNRRLFSQESGFVQNIFSYDDACEKPDNFLLAEILFFLFRNRKRVGAIGLEGYFSCQEVMDVLQKLGYVPEDVFLGLNQLVKSELVITDRMNSAEISLDDSVRILAAGWVHIRILSSRFEYLYGVIATTPISDPEAARQLAELLRIEAEQGELPYQHRIRAVDIFYRYLWKARASGGTPFDDTPHSGADYVLQHIRESIEQAKKPTKIREFEADILDV